MGISPQYVNFAIEVLPPTHFLDLSNILYKCVISVTNEASNHRDAKLGNILIIYLKFKVTSTTTTLIPPHQWRILHTVANLTFLTVSISTWENTADEVFIYSALLNLILNRLSTLLFLYITNTIISRKCSENQIISHIVAYHMKQNKPTPTKV